MNSHESLRDAENLRFRVQMNNRLRLECLAAVSKVFREFGEPIKDELLSSIVFALPQELISGNRHDANSLESYQASSNPPEKPQEPERPEPEKPGLPPEGPEPQQPGLPPESPGVDAPGLPPQQPNQSATGYIS